MVDSGYSLYWIVGPKSGTVIDLNADLVSIGRSEPGRSGPEWISIPDSSVSSHQADLVWQPEKETFLYRHRTRAAVSRIDGKPVREDQELKSSAHLGFGSSQFLLQKRRAGNKNRKTPPQRSRRYSLQLMPGGYTQELRKQGENRLGLDVILFWNPKWRCFMAANNGLSKVTVSRRDGSKRVDFPIKKPTGLEEGDELVVDFCRYLFSSQEFEELSSPKLLPYRNPKSLIPGYQRLKKLGRGCSSEVYLMLDPDGRKVAAKFLLPHLVRDPQARKSFEREGQISLDLHHPCLLDVLHVGTNDAQEKYIVAEYMPEGTLRGILRREGKLGYKDVVSVALDVATGLHYLHQKRLVHRDVKPSNIFLNSGRAVLADFGIVKGAEKIEGAPESYTVGTPHYMAPERFRGRASPESDQYSLGVVLLELLTGKRLFESSDSLTLAHLHVHQEPEDLEKRLKGMPDGVSAVLKRMLHKNPEQRYPGILVAAQEFAGHQ